jgi:hypothetical protein
MTMFRRSTEGDQRNPHVSLPDLHSQALIDRQVSTPRVLPPFDEVQSRPASASRTVTHSGSESYWDSSKMAVSGPPIPLDDTPRGFQLVGVWDGLVTKVTRDTLVVRVIPLKGIGEEAEAEFLLSDVPERDRPLVQPGAPLYWFIGYDTTLGRRRRTSELKMRQVDLTSESASNWADSVVSIILDESRSVPTEG